MREHSDHVVFGLRFQTLVGAGGVGFLQAEQFRLIEGRKIFAPARPQIAAGTRMLLAREEPTRETRTATRGSNLEARRR
jgi:hypothetical protein